MKGLLTVVGLGPGDPRYLTPAASEALASATDLVGYGPYVDRVPERPGQRRHSSDNRVELDRARVAFDLAAKGAHVAVVSVVEAHVAFLVVRASQKRERPQGRGRHDHPGGQAGRNWSLHALRCLHAFQLALARNKLLATSNVERGALAALALERKA